MESGLTNHQLSEELDQQRGSRHCHGSLLVGARAQTSSGLRINRFLVRANTKNIAVIGECAQAVMKVLGAWPVW